MNTGTYDKKRDFILTISPPSMDILISSNLERLIYQIAEGDTDMTKSLMEALTHEGQYTISDKMKEGLGHFYGNYADQGETKAIIKEVFDKTNYLMDPHTAVGYDVYNKYKEASGDATKTVIASTASPYKFTRSTMTALSDAYNDISDFDLVEEMHKVSGVEIPNAIHEALEAEVRHTENCSNEAMRDTIKSFLKI